MHKQQKEWCLALKEVFPKYFCGVDVLDIGSLDVNGTNRELFENCNYTGLDVVAGDGVDVVCVAHKYFPKVNRKKKHSAIKRFNVVLSTNALEHDMYADKTIPHMVELLKPEGLMFFSASHSHGEHGTRAHRARGSGTSELDSEWADYYRNLTFREVHNLVPFGQFHIFDLSIAGPDLRFWGIKK